MWSHTTLTGNYGFQSIQHSHTRAERRASPSFTKGRNTEHTCAQSDETDLISSSFLILRQDWNDAVCSCVTQRLAASLAGVTSPVGRSLCIGHVAPIPLTDSGKKNHPVALVRQCVMLLIPTGLQALIVCRWKRNNYGIRRLWQMEVTCTEKSFRELEFLWTYTSAFFHTRTLLRFCCMSTVSLQEGDEWFGDSLWWLSSPAEASSHFHFCCFLHIF